ncbi:hypothetical protein FOA43_001060 [Brettanomyces nanus]|uniref:Phospholipid-transporting ATPase n=1 Tax=Eeniella nana TaxID=13502 RepID=A0A875RTQ4_EENNA|nr:uncharacterized protein FOA43_001060 [Brettanomyces nanus]QPG73747.1 hypothetical protein FOA43_001060 [Brettanomyces nanus]
MFSLAFLHRKQPPAQKRQIFFNEPVPSEQLNEKGTPKQRFPQNRIRTTKYTAWDFIPRDLAFQFRNVANCYFLVIIVLGFFQIFGVQNPVMQAVPLIIIIVLTAIKDAVEDLRRARFDHEMNNSRVHVLAGIPNHNIVIVKPNIWTKCGDWLSRAMWDTGGSVVSKVTRSGKPKQKSTTRRDKQGEKPPVERTSDGIAPVRSSISAHSTISAISATSAAFTNLAATVSGMSAITGIGSLAPIRPSISTVRGTGKVSRFVSDTITNPNILPSGQSKFQNTYWKFLNVGDIIRVHENEEIPSDVVILATNDEKGLAYVETKNLDGETNLKLKESVQCGRGIKHASDFDRSAFSIETEPPTKDLYKFRGVMRYQSFRNNHDTVGTPKSESVSYKNIMLRGCTLRNVRWALCCVVATGRDTKIMLNSGATPSKRSKIAKELNLFVIINFAILFVMCLAAGLINGLYYRRKNVSRVYFEYKPLAGWSAAANGSVGFFVNLILYQTLVPISLYITIEIIKVFQAFFIFCDVSMIYEKLDFPCTPKSWNISDDLGQIEYVFSDKTGTLTENIMEFKKCSIAGKQYGISYTDAEQGMDKRHGVDVSRKLSEMQEKISADRVQMLKLLGNIKNDQFQADKVTFVSSEFVEDLLNYKDPSRQAANKEFFLALALCHNVMTGDTKNDEGLLVYKAESPDEEALVDAARNIGIVFREKSREGQVVSQFGENPLCYKLLQSLAFNSTRKRMSVIVQRPDESIVLYCKGADNVMYERLKRNDTNEIPAKTAIHLGEFAEEGLRTLVIAKRELSAQEFDQWHLEYLQASKSVENDREQKMEAVGEKIERQMSLLGGTAIEDKLQEGVPSSISLMRRAGIKLWVLTGDKVETAISIGFSCNLLANEMELLVIQGDDESVCQLVGTMLKEKFGMEGSKNDLKAAVKDHSTPQQTFAVVVDGRALIEIMADKEAQRKFLLLCKQCSSVLCCRVSPAQKAEIVKMVKNGLKVMTLAIGDGANDVSMIQTANVGIGIAGQEGRQAAMSSDYAIGQFRFLVRMLLVHGRWAYRRFAEMIPCFFYKNVVFVFPLFWYGIFSNFDGTYLYEYSYLMLFNLFFTSVPVITMGCLDQDVSASVSLAVPELYRSGITNSHWSTTRFVLYMLDGMYQSFVCFFFTWFLHWQGIYANQQGVQVDHRFWCGIYCAAIAVVSCNTYVLLRQYRWDWLTLVFWFLSNAILFIWTLLWTAGETSSTVFYKAALECYGSVSFWALCGVGILACMLPRIVIDTFQKVLFPKDIDIVREQVRAGLFKALPENYDPTNTKLSSLTVNASTTTTGERSQADPELPSRDRAFSRTFKKALHIVGGHKKSALTRLKEEMVQKGQASPRSSLDGIRTSSDLGLSSPSRLMRVYTTRSEVDL